MSKNILCFFFLFIFCFIGIFFAHHCFLLQFIDLLWIIYFPSLSDFRSYYPNAILASHEKKRRNKREILRPICGRRVISLHEKERKEVMGAINDTGA